MSKIDTRFKKIYRGVKKRPLIHAIIWSTLMVGLLFFTFVWVPYKQNERQLTIIKQRITDSRNGLEELKALMAVVTQEPTSFNDAGVAYRLRTQTDAASRAIKIIDDIPRTLTEEKELLTTTHALILYPSFTKTLKENITLDITVDADVLTSLKNEIDMHKKVNQAVLNLIVFDPETYFVETENLFTKLDALKKTIANTLDSLTVVYAQNGDTRVEKAKDLIEPLHATLIDALDALSLDNTHEAEAFKDAFIIRTTNAQKSLKSPTNTALLSNTISESSTRFIDDLLERISRVNTNSNSITFCNIFAFTRSTG